MHDACVKPALAADFIEGERDFSIFVDLPGVELVDLAVHLVEGSLQIQAQRRLMSDRIQMITDISSPNERFYGAVERTIPLPMFVDEETAEAFFENGVLRVTFQKKDTSKQVTVNAEK